MQDYTEQEKDELINRFVCGDCHSGLNVMFAPDRRYFVRCQNPDCDGTYFVTKAFVDGRTQTARTQYRAIREAARVAKIPGYFVEKFNVDLALKDLGY